MPGKPPPGISVSDGDLVDQPDGRPTRKTVYQAVGSIVAALVLNAAAWAAGIHPALAFLKDADVQAALAVVGMTIGWQVAAQLIGFLVGYSARERARGAVRPIDAARPDDDPPPGASSR